jgi:transcriptional regulator with XRE-family HTH domain
MKVNLGENIRKLRKQKALTQENLAEALGVTVGGISKWELGASTPDIQYIVEIAEFFETSVDVLFGYDLNNSNLNNALEELSKCRLSKDYSRGVLVIEKALQKYPNNFIVTYKCAQLLTLNGIEKKDKDITERAIKLLYRSIDLYPQNTDDSITEIEIYIEIAECLMTVKQNEEALQLLKKHNPIGINNALIAMIYAMELHKPDEALPFLTKSFGSSLQLLIRTMVGFVNIYLDKKQYEKAYDALTWLMHTLSGVKRSETVVSYVDKLIAIFSVGCADLAMYLKKPDLARTHIENAYRIGKLFDANPDYGITNLKFCEYAMKTAIAYDDLGETAFSGIQNSINESIENKDELNRLWEEINDENS